MPNDPRLPDGTYRTAELSRGDLVAAGKKAGLSRSQVQQVLQTENIKASAAFGLKIQNGQWTQFYSYDQAADGIGSRGTYKVRERDTFVTTEECCGESTLRYRQEGETLVFRWMKDEKMDRQGCLRDADCPGAIVVWESAPFSRI